MKNHRNVISRKLKGLWRILDAKFATTETYMRAQTFLGPSKFTFFFSIFSENNKNLLYLGNEKDCSHIGKKIATPELTLNASKNRVGNFKFCKPNFSEKLLKNHKKKVTPRNVNASDQSHLDVKFDTPKMGF